MLAAEHKDGLVRSEPRIPNIRKKKSQTSALRFYVFMAITELNNSGLVVCCLSFGNSSSTQTWTLFLFVFIQIQEWLDVSLLDWLLLSINDPSVASLGDKCLLNSFSLVMKPGEVGTRPQIASCSHDLGLGQLTTHPQVQRNSQHYSWISDKGLRLSLSTEVVPGHTQLLSAECRPFELKCIVMCKIQPRSPKFGTKENVKHFSNINTD